MPKVKTTKQTPRIKTLKKAAIIFGDLPFSEPADFPVFKHYCGYSVEEGGECLEACPKSTLGLVGYCKVGRNPNQVTYIPLPNLPLAIRPFLCTEHQLRECGLCGVFVQTLTHYRCYRWSLKERDFVFTNQPPEKVPDPLVFGKATEEPRQKKRQELLKPKSIPSRDLIRFPNY